MGKSVHIPENLSKTQYVEEMFRNIKDAPENKKNEAMRNQVRHLRHEGQDVHNLEKGAAPEEQNEDEDSMYRDDTVELSDKDRDDNKAQDEDELKLDQDDDENLDEEDVINQEYFDYGIEFIENNEEEEEDDPKGRFLDIEG